MDERGRRAPAIAKNAQVGAAAFSCRCMPGCALCEGPLPVAEAAVLVGVANAQKASGFYAAALWRGGPCANAQGGELAAELQAEHKAAAKSVPICLCKHRRKPVFKSLVYTLKIDAS